MEIKEYVKIYDNCIPYESLSKFIKWINTIEFQDATVIGFDQNQKSIAVLNKEKRSVKEHGLFFTSKSMPNFNWFNYLTETFEKKIGQYYKNFKHAPHVRNIQSMSILKYEKNDHYVWHTEDSVAARRTLSLIFLLNNDYEGGELLFGDTITEEEVYRVAVKPNRLIVWPSSFIFPHKVLPVKKGVRYSVVSWLV